MVFDDVLASVDSRRRRLVFYNAESRDHCERVIDYVGVHNVDISYVDNPEEPDATVAVETDDTRLASDDIAAVAAYIDCWDTDLSTEMSTPTVFQALDETVFRSKNKAQLVLASRLIETRAAQSESGRLAAGFQRLSLVRPQLSLYTALPSAVTVALYGEPDWLPPADSGIAAYDPVAESHNNYWWVLFDGTDNPDQHAALIAEQTDADTYTGFWTYRPSLVADIAEIVDRLETVQVAGP